jgi:CHAT domain-containing protein
MSLARLVTLSICETGITDIMTGSSDEFVGLPAFYSFAGILFLVSILWSIPGISTTLLMNRFYSNHIVLDIDIPHVLQDS